MYIFKSKGLWFSKVFFDFIRFWVDYRPIICVVYLTLLNTHIYQQVSRGFGDEADLEDVGRLETDKFGWVFVGAQCLCMTCFVLLLVCIFLIIDWGCLSLSTWCPVKFFFVDCAVFITFNQIYSSFFSVWPAEPDTMGCDASKITIWWHQSFRTLQCEAPWPQSFWFLSCGQIFKEPNK
jgi:hypothetical protein